MCVRDGTLYTAKDNQICQTSPLPHPLSTFRLALYIMYYQLSSSLGVSEHITVVHLNSSGGIITYMRCSTQNTDIVMYLTKFIMLKRLFEKAFNHI